MRISIFELSEKWGTYSGNSGCCGSYSPEIIVKEKVIRGAITLHPGDSYEVMENLYVDKGNGNSEVQHRGKITRSDGSVEITPIGDIDFIDVQENQEFEFIQSGWWSVSVVTVSEENPEYNNDLYVPKSETIGVNENGPDVRTPNKGEIKTPGSLFSTKTGPIEFRDSQENGTILIFGETDNFQVNEPQE